MDLLNALTMGPFSLGTNSVTRGCVYNGHTSGSPAYSDKANTHWDFKITVMTVRNYFTDKISSKRHVRIVHFL